MKELLGARYAKTLFVLTSDHGHSNVNWRVAVGATAIRRAIDRLAPSPSLNPSYRLNLLGPTTNYNPHANVVTSLNGGSLGLYVAADRNDWSRHPNCESDLLPLLKDFLTILHGTNRAPEAVFIQHDGHYKKLKYSIQPGKAEMNGCEFQSLDDVFKARQGLYPDAVRRLEGLLPPSGTSAQRNNAPDVIVLADRGLQHTFANDQDPDFKAKRNLPGSEQLRSDHGHLSVGDSLVPIIFASAAFRRRSSQEPLSSVCEASVVDITPTVVDILLPAHLRLQRESYEDGLAGHPNYSQHFGQSQSEVLTNILRGQDKDQINVCPSIVFTHYPPPKPAAASLDALVLSQDEDQALRDLKAKLLLTPELFHRGHKVSRTLTYILDNKDNKPGGLILHSHDRLTGKPASTKRLPTELWMLSDPPPATSVTLVNDKKQNTVLQRRSGIALYRIPVGEEFDVVEAQTLRQGDQCADRMRWDWLGGVNRWEFPGELVIQVVYRTKPQTMRFYYFDVNLESPVRPRELFDLEKQMAQEDLESILGEIKRLRQKEKESFPDLEVEKLMEGYRFKVPNEYLAAEGSGSPERFFGIRHTCW